MNLSTLVDIRMYPYLCKRKYMFWNGIDNACLDSQKAIDVRNHVKPISKWILWRLIIANYIYYVSRQSVDEQMQEMIKIRTKIMSYDRWKHNW